MCIYFVRKRDKEKNKNNKCNVIINLDTNKKCKLWVLIIVYINNKFNNVCVMIVIVSRV